MDQRKDYAVNVEEHVLPGCWHWITDEYPAQLYPLIINFINQK
ncbi:alpha/beta hydrolase [Salmonella enterica subsp. salamae]|nr:alpha/beta hydrolase [Salmonella enterica subsp. salamae]